MGTFAGEIKGRRCRHPGFLTPTGAGTLIAEGKEVRIINGKECLLETALTTGLRICARLES
jgi:acyl CoA:acetate/3-ketoacid CoA transferase alpha subunit